MKSRKTKVLASLMLVLLLLLAVNVSVFAAAPAFTSATYNVGTGAFVITGTNLVAKTSTNNDIDLTKITITDGINHTYTLTGKGEITNATTATLTLNDKDKAALAVFLDKAGTTGNNGGTYNVTVLAGWNGTTSANDLGTNALTVSGVATVTTATYDVSTGNLVITGVAMSANAVEAKTDVTPKYFYVTDGATKKYILKTSSVVKLTNATSVTITLNAADQLALQGIFDKNGTTSVAGNTYSLKALAGWNGTGSTADMGSNVITLSNYAAPVVTLTENATVTYGGNITTALTTLATTKPGTMYIIPATTVIDGSTTKADLDALVTAKTAVKATVTNIAAVSVSTKGLEMTVASADYKAIAVDLSNNLSALSANKITINNVAAPALTVTVAKSATLGTKVTATAGSGNTFVYAVSTTSITTPAKCTDLTQAIADEDVTAYTSGADISGVDPTTNKYLGIYEIDGDKKVVKFKQIVMSTSNCQLAGATAPGATLAVGGATPVGGVTNVAVPAAGATDTTGKVTGWVASTANKIKFTVTNNGAATSTVKINGSSYTSGNDYAITSTSDLTIVVTTTETGRATGVRTFTVTVAQAVATAPTGVTLAVGGAQPVGGVTNVAIPAAGATDTTGAVTGWTATSADKIKFTVTNAANTSSTITINGAAYTSGADYTVAAATPLTIVITTTEAGKANSVRTFTVSVTAA